VALDDVSLTVEDGEFLTILGPSGSGKTTMLLAIAGFEPPTSGSISFDDRDVTGLPAHKRKVGLTFQSYALFPHMCAYKNIAFPLRVRNVPRSEANRMVQDALRIVRLEGYGDRRPSELSGGQQQRVALARAFVFKPDTLLLDEPLAALDRQLRQTVQVELKELQRSLGITTIAVTHDQEEALTMSDRIMVLHEGRVHQHGAPREVYDHPNTRFVAGFLGTANIFDGIVGVSDEQRSMQCVGLTSRLPVPRDAPIGRQTVMVRPEHVRILSATSDLGIRGVVMTSVYLGSSARYRVMIEGDRIIEILEPSRCRVNAGDSVRIHWASEDTWIIPEEEKDPKS
jgi:spermidine/putrescine ABC transporter ATP-binding subunit